MVKPVPAPSEEQLAIMVACQEHPCVIVEAGPGCAKSTTARLTMLMLPDRNRTSTYYFAFNKDTADEFARDVPFGVKVQTFNAFGLGLLTKHLGHKPTLDVKKTNNILREIADGDRWSIAPEEVEIFKTLTKFAKSQGWVPSGEGNLKIPNAPTFRQLCDLADVRPEPHYEKVLSVIINMSISQAFKGIIDFDDQVYMTALFCEARHFPKISWLFVDEAQDMSPLQLWLVQRCRAEHLCIVGDPYQCHPPGTEINRGWESVPVEDLQVGDALTTYDTHATSFIGVEYGVDKVTDKVCQHYEGKLYTVNLAGNSTKLTHNHKVLARISPDRKQWYATYLMKKGPHFRVGMCALYYQTGGGAFGPAARARSEGADCVWVLSTHATAEEARAEEAINSALYNIPDLMFKNNGSQAIPQARLDHIWETVGHNLVNAVACLKAYQLYLDLPIWSDWNSDGDKHGTKFSTKSFVTSVCNVHPNVMQMVYMAEPQARGQVWEYPEISHEPYSGDVYGITVEPRPNGRRLYLTDNIVVHNCIYAFRGAMSDSFDRIHAAWPDAVVLPLQTSYRLPTAVCDLLRDHNPRLTTAKKDPGLVTTITQAATMQQHVSHYANGSPAALLCRNNAPLYRAALSCIASHQPFNIRDNGWGFALVRDLRKVCGKHTEIARIPHLMAEFWARPDMTPSQAELVVDKITTLMALADGLESSGQLADRLADVLKKTNPSDAGHPLHLSTAHKAKGMEWPTVFHLDSNLIPSQFAKTEEDFSQEANIAYVLNSRAQQSLIFLSSAHILIPSMPVARTRPDIRRRQVL